MAFHVGRSDMAAGVGRVRPAAASWCPRAARCRSTSSMRRAARSPRRPRRPTSRRSTSRASTRSPGRSTSRAPSRATPSRSSCSSSTRRTGAGPRASPGSGCWRTTSPTRRCGSRALHDGIGELLPGVRIPLAPFCGVLGLASPGEPRSTIPPTASGGNMDTRHLTAGLAPLAAGDRAGRGCSASATATRRRATARSAARRSRRRCGPACA